MATRKDPQDKLHRKLLLARGKAYDRMRDALDKRNDAQAKYDRALTEWQDAHEAWSQAMKDRDARILASFKVSAAKPLPPV